MQPHNPPLTWRTLLCLLHFPDYAADTGWKQVGIPHPLSPRTWNGSASCQLWPHCGCGVLSMGLNLPRRAGQPRTGPGHIHLCRITVTFLLVSQSFPTALTSTGAGRSLKPSSVPNTYQGEEDRGTAGCQDCCNLKDREGKPSASHGGCLTTVTLSQMLHLRGLGVVSVGETGDNHPADKEAEAYKGSH